MTSPSIVFHGPPTALRVIACPSAVRRRVMIFTTPPHGVRAIYRRRRTTDDFYTLHPGLSAYASGTGWLKSPTKSGRPSTRKSTCELGFPPTPRIFTFPAELEPSPNPITPRSVTEMPGAALTIPSMTLVAPRRRISLPLTTVTERGRFLRIVSVRVEVTTTGSMTYVVSSISARGAVARSAQERNSVVRQLVHGNLQGGYRNSEGEKALGLSDRRYAMSEEHARVRALRCCGADVFRTAHRVRRPTCSRNQICLYTPATEQLPNEASSVTKLVATAISFSPLSITNWPIAGISEGIA